MIRLLSCLVGCTVKSVKTATLKKVKNWFQDQLSLNSGKIMQNAEHSAILSTFVKLPLVIKIFVLSIFEWLL